MILEHVSEKLRLSVAYAYEQWCRGVLARRAATDAEQKLKESYETIKAQAAEVQAAIASISHEAEHVTPTE